MIVIHGENLVASWQKLSQLIDQAKSQKTNILQFEAKNLDATTLSQSLRSPGLFDNKQLIIIFNLLTLPQSVLKKALINLLKKQKNNSIVLYENKNAHPSTIKSLSPQAVHYFKPDAIIFKFLESLSPQHKKESLRLLNQLLDSRQSPELIFAMLIRHLRQLIKAQNPKVANLPAWLLRKLTTQARLFGNDRLLKLHQQLYRIDKQIKTGVKPPDLITQLNHFLLSL